MGTIRWERLSSLSTPVLMILAILVLVGGVSTGAFLICLPAGWITVGVLGGLGLAFLAWVTDGGETHGRRA